MDVYNRENLLHVVKNHMVDDIIEFFPFSCSRSQNFAQARIVNKSGIRLVDDIAGDLKVMLDVRINAVKVNSN